MKNIRFAYGVLFLIVFQSCCSPFTNCEDDFVEPISRYEPVYLDRAEFVNSVVLKNHINIAISGKIYVQDDLLFINELFKGFHIYDNSDPSNPQAIKFIEAPGSTDMAIRGNVIYVNQATDLIALEYNSETNTVAITKRIPNTFPPLRSPDGEQAYNIPENSVVIDWKLKN